MEANTDGHRRVLCHKIRDTRTRLEDEIKLRALFGNPGRQVRPQHACPGIPGGSAHPVVEFGARHR